jgi:hypothetical protein
MGAADLLALVDHPAFTRRELIACLGGHDRGLALLASGCGRGRGPPLDWRDWVRLVWGLARHASAVVVDCGPGLGGPGARVALATADQVVLVAEPHPSPATRWTARTLVDRGLPVVVVRAWEPPGPDAVGHADQLPGIRGVVPFPAGVRGVAPCPPGHSAEPIPTPWRDHARRLAQLLVADWTALGIGEPPDPSTGSGGSAPQ